MGRCQEKQSMIKAAWALLKYLVGAIKKSWSGLGLKGVGSFDSGCHAACFLDDYDYCNADLSMLRIENSPGVVR